MIRETGDSTSVVTKEVYSCDTCGWPGLVHKLYVIPELHLGVRKGAAQPASWKYGQHGRGSWGVSNSPSWADVLVQVQAKPGVWERQDDKERL